METRFFQKLHTSTVDMAEQDVPDNDHQGMWLIWFDSNPRARDEAKSKLIQASKERILSIWLMHDMTMDEHFIGCITKDDRDVRDIYTTGNEIRQVLGELFSEAQMYYKTKEKIMQGLSSRGGDERICKYALRHNGRLQERDPFDDSEWVDVQMDNTEVNMAECGLSYNDHRGMWLIWFDESPQTRRKALSKLVQASKEEKLNIWQKDINAVEQAIGIITKDDGDVRDIYKMGIKIRKVLGELSSEARMYYKMKEAILLGLSSRRGDVRICKYTLRHDGSFQERCSSDDSQWVDVHIDDVLVKD